MNILVDNLNARGLNAMSLGDYETAKDLFTQAYRASPINETTVSNLSDALFELKQRDVAVTLLKRQLATRPNDAFLLAKLGGLLLKLNHLQEAEDVLRKAIRLDNTELMQRRSGEIISCKIAALSTLTWVLQRQRKYKEALVCIQTIESETGRTRQTDGDKAMSLLALGDLRAAFPLYEVRDVVKLPFNIPAWRGEDLAGKRILLYAEQGFGDMIMAARFAKNLVAKGAEVILGMPPALVRLFDFQRWSKITVVAGIDSQLASTLDYAVSMFSAIDYLKIEVSDIDSAPYLNAPVQSFGITKAFNVGICWASAKRTADVLGLTTDDFRRVTSLTDWISFAEIPHVKLWSLQKGENSKDAASVIADILIESPALVDFADTAALISNLDLVITVDSAAAHLAGALGKPVWMLAQYSNCWRWWDIENGTGRPWYSSMKIFRQPNPHDWNNVLKKCRMELEVVAHI